MSLTRSFVGLRLRGAARCLRERPDDGPARQIDFEGVVPKAFGLAQNEIGRMRKRCLVGRPAGEPGFGLRIAPRLVCNATQRETRLLDRAAVELEADRDRYQCERIGEPVANLEVSVVCRKSLRRHLDRGHELIRFEIGIASRRIAGSR